MSPKDCWTRYVHEYLSTRRRQVDGVLIRRSCSVSISHRSTMAFLAWIMLSHETYCAVRVLKLADEGSRDLEACEGSAIPSSLAKAGSFLSIWRAGRSGVSSAALWRV